MKAVSPVLPILLTLLVEIKAFGVVPPSPLSRCAIHHLQVPTAHSAAGQRSSKDRLHQTELNAFFRRIFSRKGKSKEEGNVQEGADDDSIAQSTAPPELEETDLSASVGKPTENASIVIIGGGVSGLTAAMTASKGFKPSGDGEDKIVLLEASEKLGGRVQSDLTDDGFTLDRGFAVFIEEYPVAKELLDYEELKLGRFQPGALVKVKDSDELARVADPLRQPEDIFTALLAPVGTLEDKIRLLPLIFHALTTSVEDLFQERETDTLTALKDRWGFSDVLLDRFFKPFLEGIYLAPLSEQSSRMFMFVFKMFSEGYATLPEGGMCAVANQLGKKVQDAGVDVRLGTTVSKITKNKDGFLVQTVDQKTRIQAKSIVLATDGHVAQKLMSHVDGFESLESLPEQPQRSVGCLYYSFDGPAPVQDPILILNGIGEERGNEKNPVNNVCFPSVVNKGYAPEGKSLCSVTVLKNAMDAYKGREKELDTAVRQQLGTWFPDMKDGIANKWQLKRIYSIPNAQPGQLVGPAPANVNQGRDCTTYRGKKLPDGLVVCGDHMATATLNGALESGVNAGTAAAKAAKVAR